jgi:sugar phosphate isomerase/epimerase
MLGAALLHSVSYSGSWGQAYLPVEQFVEKAADLGYEGVLLMAKRLHLSPLDWNDRDRARLRTLIEKRGLRPIALAGYTNFTGDLEHGDIPHREIQVSYVVELARLARDLGGDVVRVFTGYENPAAGYSAQWKLVVECLRECAQRAAEFGVTIGVQNHHDVAAGWESMRDLIRAVSQPNCRALFDAWAPALHGADIVRAAREMGGITAHTTIANYQYRPRYRYEPAIVNYVPQPPAMQAVPIEEGFIDYAAFLSALVEGGFSGTVAYEMCSPLRDGNDLETLDRYARGFLDFYARCRQTASAAVSG